MGEFIYAEYAIGGLQNRNQIFQKRDFTLDGIRNDCSRSLFLFDEGLQAWVDRTGSVSGFAGSHISDMLAFDFDGEDLEKVRAEVVKFCHYIEVQYEVPLEYVRTAFSGSKGFHVTIPMQVIGDVTPSTNFWQVYRGICVDMAGDFQIDRGIYEIRKLFRMLSTINGKSGLYKIPLTINELENLSIDSIRELAKKPRTIETLPASEMRPVPALEELYKKWLAHGFVTTASPRSTNGDLLSLLDGVQEGARSDAGIKLAGLYISKGFDESLTLKHLQTWNNLNTPPMEERELETIVRGAFKRYSSQDANVADVYDFLKAGEAYREQAANLSKRKVTTGFSDLDKKLRGIIPGETMCVQGKTSVGKSAFLQNIGHNFAKLSGEPVLFFSIEMPITSVFERACQVEMNTSGYEVERVFQMNTDEIHESAEFLFHKLPNFYTITRTGLNLEKIKGWVRFAEETVYHKKTGLVLIDYLGLVQSDGKDIYQQVSRVARGIKEMAKELDTAIVFLSQVNKSKGDSEELDVNSARDSGSIAEAADFVLSIWKDPNMKDRHDENIYLKVGISKNRKGGCGTLSFTMDRRSLKFTELSEDEDKPAAVGFQEVENAS